jgi:hypothetical protein
MNTWNKDSNIANDDMRVVKFNINTDQGDGYITAMVNKGVSINDAKVAVLDQIKGYYSSAEITSYEILEIIPDDDTPMH